MQVSTPLLRKPDKRNSSAISKMGYADNKMFVGFKKGNAERTYSYLGVPPQIFINMVNASSPGKFFNTNIRGKYIAERI